MMSLIIEALRRAEMGLQDPDAGQPEPGRQAEQFCDEPPGESVPDLSAVPAVEEDVACALDHKRASIRGAAVLSTCVLAAVALLMRLSLPPDQKGPAPASAGGSAAWREGGADRASQPDRPNETRRENASIIPLPAADEAETTQPPDPARRDESAAAAQAALPKPAERPAAETFTLGGILASGRDTYAIINNQMVSVGDEIDGARVIAIKKYHVVLLKDGKRLLLRL